MNLLNKRDLLEPVWRWDNEPGLKRDLVVRVGVVPNSRLASVRDTPDVGRHFAACIAATVILALTQKG